MGQFLVETWLAAHKGQVPEGQWQARRENWTPEKSAQGWAETLRDIGTGKSPDYCVYVAVDAAEPPEIIGMVIGVLLRRRPGICRRFILTILRWRGVRDGVEDGE